MFAFAMLIVRRSLRNAPLTAAVLIGLLVLVTLLVAAPLYTTALADVGLRATLADAPLDQRSVRIRLPVDELSEARHREQSAAITAAGGAAAWLKPGLLSAVRTKRLVLPGGDTTRRVTLVEADTALENLRVVEGRLPQSTAAGAAVEVALGTNAAEQFAVAVGDTLPLAERDGGDPLVPITVVGLVEPADAQATFWQSGVLDLEPAVGATQSEATLVLAPGVLWQRVISLLPPERASGEGRWRLVFDTSVVNGDNATQAEAVVAQVLGAVGKAMPGAEVQSDFGNIVSAYRQRLSVARAPLLLLLSEMAGLALIYVAWTAAFQAEAAASEQAVMGARGAGVGQIMAISGGQAALLALGAALVGIPLTVLMLRATVQFGPVAELARTQGLRLAATADARSYANGAALIGWLALAIPAIPAARRSIIALRQGAARPAGSPAWQRSYLDVILAILALVAFVQLQRQGTVLQQIRGRFEIDPFLLVAPLLVLVAGALLFLRLYPLALGLARRWTERLRGLPLNLALVQLTRNRAASTRLVVLLSLAVALGLFAQTFGATLALNQQQRAGYTVGASGRATLTSTEPLAPGALPTGVRGTGALRDSVKIVGSRSAPATLLAVDPAQFTAVAFNPAEHPLVPIADAMATLGATPPADGIELPGQPRELSLTLSPTDGQYDPAVILTDVAGRYHRLRMQLRPGSQTFAAKLDLPATLFPLRLVTIALLPSKQVRFRPASGNQPRELVKPPQTINLGFLALDGMILERWDGAHTWEASIDTSLDPQQEQAGTVDLEVPEANQQPVTIALGRGTRAVLLRPDPQTVAPIPVLVNEPFLTTNGLGLGDTTLFSFHNRQVPMRIAGVLPRFPSLGIDAAPFVVAHGPRLLRWLNTSYVQPVTPNELWLDLPSDPAAAAAVRATRGIGGLLLTSGVLRSYGRDPLAVGIAGVFFLGFVTSVALAALGFAIATYLAGRRRTVEFAVLQAIGLDRRAVLGTLALEQAVLVGLALVAGTVLGSALGRLILPFMAVSDRGRVAVPPYTIVVPWSTLALTYAGLVLLFVMVTVAVLWLLLGRGIGSALRIGED